MITGLFKLAFTALKWCAIAVVIVLLANTIRVDGITLSDHIARKIELAQELSIVKSISQSIQNGAHTVGHDYFPKVFDTAKLGARRLSQALTDGKQKADVKTSSELLGATRAAVPTETPSDETFPSERQKLKALIQELNTARTARH